MRSVLIAAAICLLGLTGSGLAVAQGLPGGVIPRVPLRRHGIERAWVAQADVSVGRSRIADLTLNHGTLFVQSDVGLLQAMDAETGRTLWRTQVGNRSYPSVAPGIGEEFIGVANGSTLYLLDRSNGRIRWEWALAGSPTAGVSIDSDTVYVPTIRNRVESYALREQLEDGTRTFAKPGRGQAFRGVSGVPQTACLLTPNAIAVGTNTGSLYGFSPNSVGPRYTVDTYGEIVAAPAYYKGNVIVASRDQYLYAIHETDGDMSWRLSLGEPLNHGPVVVKDKIFVVADLSGMYQISGDSGDELWFAPGIKQFVAAGANRIYARDGMNRLQVLDAATGKRVDSLPTEAYAVMYSNTENDRIYLASEAGLLHCLREAALVEPLIYRKADVEKPAATVQTPLDAAAAAAPVQAPAAAVEPAEDDAAPDEDAEKPEVEDDDLGAFGEE